MKKGNYKKLALLGIAGGLLMASQVAVADLDQNTHAGRGVMLAGGCGSNGHCNSFNPTRTTHSDDDKTESSPSSTTSPTSAPKVPQTLPNEKDQVADNKKEQKSK